MNTSTPIPRLLSGATCRVARCPAWGRLPVSGVLAAVALLAGAARAMAQAPDNDAFSGRLPIVGSTNTVTGTNVGASAEAGEPARADQVATASVWWSWVAPDNGMVTIETAASGFDTVLAAYTGSRVDALTLVASNDDAPGLATSQLTFPAVQGTTYQLAVDGFNGARGSIQLGVRLPVAPTPPTITRQLVSQHVRDQAGSNVTFAVTVAGSFPLSFEWQRDGTPLAGGTNASYTVIRPTQADAGIYRVVVRNAMGTTTSSIATLAVRDGLAQDFFATPEVIGGQSQSLAVHNVGATIEPGEPRHAGVATGASVWWSWIAPQSGLVHLNTAGSTNALGETLDTALAVYDGDQLDNLAPVASNNDEAPGLIRSSRLVFRARAGAVYRIAVAGLEDRSGAAAVGDIRLNLGQGADNDHFTNALPIPEGATTVRDDNRGATAEAGEPRHAGNPGGKSVWWSWTAPSDGYYLADTVGSGIDTLLGVYTGASLAGLVHVAGDDSRLGAGASLVKFFARAGTRFHFAVDGLGVEAGAIVLNINPVDASNDDFTERINISGRTNRLSASNVGATKEAGESDHGGNAGGRSVWWTWTAPVTGTVLVSTRGSAIDTSLAVYSGTRLGALTLLGQNDDADPADPFSGSQVGFQGQAGQAYQIAVDGYRDEDGTVPEGDIVLTLVQADLPTDGSNDLFANRLPLTGQTHVAVGLNARASREPGEPKHAENDGGRSLWWSWVAPASGPATISTVGSSFGTLLAAYQGDRVDALTLLDQDQNSAGNGWSIVTFRAEQGRQYQIAVDGFNNGTGAEFGDVILTLRQFPDGPLHANDDFADATPIADPFLNVKGSNIEATRQVDEPKHAGAEQGHSVWWSWTAPASGPVSMSTAGSQFDTLLSVYTGNALGALRLVAENDDIHPFDEQSRVTFEAVAGQTYRIAVDGYGREMGFIDLTVAPRPDLAGAPEVQQQPADQTRFLDGAGEGSAVVFRVGATGAPPLAFQWTHDGVELAGATNEVLTLDQVASPDAGAYRVRIRNDLGEVTSLPARLTYVARPFNDEFALRTEIEGGAASVRGSIMRATKQDAEPNHGGGTGGRSVWWRWVAPTSGPVEIHTFGSSFDTLLGVYEGSDVRTLVPIALNDDAVVGRVAASRVVFNAVAMREYQIAVDAHKTNSDGSVVLSVHQPVRFDPVPPSVTISPPSTNLNRAGVVTYTITYADENFDQSTLGASDIILNRTGTANGLVTVSGSGNTRLVTLFRITGDGTLGISLGAGTAGDTAGNLAPASSPSAVFEVDNTAPVVRLSAPVGLPGSGTVEYTVTYTDRNLLGHSLRAEDVRLHTTGTARGTVRVEGNGDTALVSITSITGTGTVGISVAAGTASDKAGNRAGESGPSESFDVLDLTAPDQPAVPRLLAASDTGVSDSDRITAAAVLTVVGSGLSGEVVTLHDGITALGSTVVSAGAWSLTISGLAQGDHDLTVVLTDSSGNRSVPSDTLRVRIDRTAPVVSQIPSPNLGAGASLDIPFIIGDSQADPADLSVQVSSSSPSLLPNSGLVLSGTGPSRSLRVSPAVSLVGGVVDITLSVRDVAGNTATPTFRLSVQAPNRPPTLDRIPMQTVQAGSGAHLVRLTGVTAGLGETQNLTLRSVSDNPALVADPLAFQTLPVGSGALVLVPAASGSGTARISVILSDDGGTAFGGIDAVTNTFAVTVAPANPDGSARIQGIVRRFDGSLELTVVLPTGRPYLLQESTDLRSWADGPVFTPLISPHSLVVPGTDDVLEKFFRVIASP